MHNFLLYTEDRCQSAQDTDINHFYSLALLYCRFRLRCCCCVPSTGGLDPTPTPMCVGSAWFPRAAQLCLGELLPLNQLQCVCVSCDGLASRSACPEPCVLRWAGIPFSVSPALGYLGEAPGPRDPLLDYHLED